MSVSRTCSIFATVSLFWASLGGGDVCAGQKTYVGRTVATGQQVSMDAIRHDDWSQLLQKYVDDDGMVDYRAWQASRTDVRLLDDYLKTLSTASTTRSASKESKLAFWINAYNAVTIRGILREYPTSSIRNHTARVFGYNIWHDFQLYVGGQPYSLDHIEHKILRRMDEPRIHFAIVCASISCPRLLNEAYTADQLTDQLETNAKDFFRRAQNFRFDQRARRFHLSSILDWFGEDFGNDQKAVLRTIAPWLPTTAARRAAQTNAASVRYLRYDWNLNEQGAVNTARR